MLCRDEVCGCIRIRCPSLYTASNIITDAGMVCCLPREMAVYYGKWISSKKIEAIIPVPLHPSKKRKRGFNQAEILARELSEQTGIPVYTDVLFRIRKTSPQKMLGPGERKANLKGAFAVSAKWKACRNVLLIDDIYTTGSTIERCAGMLKKAGTENVWFLTISIGQGI